MTGAPDLDPVTDTVSPDETRRRTIRRNSRVTALVLAAFVILVFFISIAKMAHGAYGG
ncbi:hypothetical protein [Novosphingobium sp. 9]|uniref:hypothetical protein n=1 Tax=Novosphingobium sp. 9 TaxID=2025349 RepID=UPI0021B6A6FF|nr:hypothetical protein [Novosphingobium sp. 9]